jgi:ABC-2 type transport system permease protein
MKSWEITKKDLRLLARDRRALIVLVVLPLIFITIIGLTTGRLMGWNSSNTVLKVALVDQVAYDKIGEPSEKADSEGDENEDFESFVPLTDQEKAIAHTEARNLVVKIHNRIQSRNGFEVRDFATAEEAREQYQSGKVNAAIIIGADFYRRVQELGPTDVFDRPERDPTDDLKTLDIVLESNNPESSTHSAIETVTWANVFKTVAPSVLVKFPIYRRGMQNTYAQLQAEAEAPPIQLLPPQEQKPIGGDEIYQNLIPSYTVMFVFFLVTIMARSFIHERELGTLRRLRIAPIKPASLLAGKTIPFLIISLVQTAILFICGRFLFQMSWGSEPLLLLPVIFCTSLAATALGLLLSTIVRTESQVSAYANIVVITMAGISGCFMPRKWLPDAMQEFSLVTPHAWSLIAYNQILAQPIPDLALVLECCAMLLGFTILYFIAGSIRFSTLD